MATVSWWGCWQWVLLAYWWGGAQPQRVPQLTDASGMGVLVVQAGKFRNTKGVMRMAVYDQKDTFMNPRRYYRNTAVGIGGKYATASLQLPPGRYAVSVLHDENNNDDMDYWLGLPSEGFGISNMESFPLGRPAFERCLIEVQPNQTTTVRVVMHYSL